MTVAAGTVVANLHEQLDGSGFMFPLHIGAEGSTQIGGLIGTNAGGCQAFRYGMMRDLVLGLEVVLPDGTVWDGMRRIQKDNAGYQLRKLFCGAEGTPGGVTRAVLKLVAAPISETTSLMAVPDMAAAIGVAAQCRAKAGEFLSALEFFSEVGLDMALLNIRDLNFPLQQRSHFFILVEAGAGSSQVPIEAIFSEILEDCYSIGLVVDGAIAMSKAQRNAFWSIRKEQPEGQRREGANSSTTCPCRRSSLLIFSSALHRSARPFSRAFGSIPWAILAMRMFTTTYLSQSDKGASSVWRKPLPFGWAGWPTK